MNEMGDPYKSMELASFMSCSKGYMGECGIRGGYAEVVNMDPDVKAMLMKSISAKLCPTVIGQTCMDVVVNPPKPGEPSYEVFNTQKSTILNSLADRAKLVADTFNSMEGFTCNTVQGAMYAFPRLHLPEKAIAKAKQLGQAPDVFYAFQLLENTGICIVSVFFFFNNSFQVKLVKLIHVSTYPVLCNMTQIVMHTLYLFCTQTCC